MIFTSPIALWLLLLLPIIVFAYFIKKTVRNKIIPNLFLWEEASGKSFLPSWSFGIRSVLSLLLALLITILLIGALLNPRTKKRFPESSLVVIVDNSASMGTTLHGQTRLSLALKRLNQIISNKEDTTRILIMTSGGSPEIISSFTANYGILRNCISKIKQTERPCQMKEALDLASCFTSTDVPISSLYIITDGCFEGASFLIDKNNLEQRKWFIVGEPQDNIGITRFQARRSQTGTNSYDVFIRVMNYGREEVQGELELDLDNSIVDIIPLTLSSGQVYENTRKYASDSGGILHARLVSKNNLNDSLKTDNDAWSIIPNQTELNILFYGKNDPFLLKVLESQGKLPVTFIKEVPQKLPVDTILVVHQQVPAILPEGKILIVNPQNSCDRFKIGDVIDSPLAEIVDSQTPIMRSIHLEGQMLSGGRQCEFKDGSSMKIQVKSAEAPLIFSTQKRSTLSSEQLVLNFSISENNLYLKTLFPILFTNACCYLREKIFNDNYNFSRSDLLFITIPHSYKDLQCLDSLGREVKISINQEKVSIAPPLTPGILNLYDSNHRSISQLAINLESDSESNLICNATSELRREVDKTASIVSGRPFWLILAFTILVLLVVEWMLYHRRWTE